MHLVNTHNLFLNITTHVALYKAIRLNKDEAHHYDAQDKHWSQTEEKTLKFPNISIMSLRLQNYMMARCMNSWNNQRYRDGRNDGANIVWIMIATINLTSKVHAILKEYMTSWLYHMCEHNRFDITWGNKVMLLQN